VILVAVAIGLAAAVAIIATHYAWRSSTARPQSPLSTPVPVSLTLPTTIHYGDSTSGGANLARPTSRATVTIDQALAMNHLDLPAERTQRVLADVTMPTDFYQSKVIRGLTCWVVVYTYPQPINASMGGPVGKTPVPVMVQHGVTILDARTGAFVRGFFTK
jgi:hypothetical protein